jgi:hypothetical protein
MIWVDLQDCETSYCGVNENSTLGAREVRVPREWNEKKGDGYMMEKIALDHRVKA